MIAVWLAASASAQDFAGEGFDAHGLQLAQLDGDVRDPLVVDRPAGLTQGRWWLGGLLEFADRTLVWRETLPDGTSEDIAMLDDVFGLDASAGVVVYDGIQLGFSWPLYFASTSEGAAQGAAVGDLRLQALTSLLRPSQADPVEIGLGAYLDAPTGADTAFLGQAGVAGGVRASATGSVDRLTLGGDLGFRFNPAIELGNLSGADDLQLGLAGGVLASDRTGIGIETRIAAPLASNEQPGSGTPAEALLSARHKTDGGGYVTGAFGTAVSGGAGAANWRLLIGGGFGTPEGPPKDTDGDGFIDTADACVTEPESANGYRDDDGCPDALGTLAIRAEYQGRRVVGAKVDVTDGAGAAQSNIVGPTDWTLPATPGSGWTASATYGGCLEGRAAKQAGEATTELVVALEPKRTAGVRVDVVTPDGKPVPTAKFTWVDEPTGCVPTGDAAVDAQGHLEQAVGVGSHTWTVTAPGYAAVQDSVVLAASEVKPLKVVLSPTKVNLTTTKIEILETVKFETGKAVLKAESFALLDEIASLLQIHPEILSVEVAGHTDDQGAEASNLTLSQNRAIAVKDYLVKKGVDSKRLTTAGYGESKPIAPNRLATGRAQNRRVEFVISKRADP